MSELPPVPAIWTWSSLGAFADVKLGKMLSAKARAVDLEQRPYLRNQNVRWGTLDVSDVKTMGFKPGELIRYSVQPDDLLVCEGGEPARCAVYCGPPAAFMYQKALHRVRPYPGTADPRFLQYCLWHYASNGVVLPRPSETTIQHLPLEEMQALPIPLPPLAEQRRIVEALDTHFTRLDAAVATLERVRANLKRYRAAVLQAAIEGRLTSPPSERSGDGLPASWTWMRIEELTPRERPSAYGVLQPGADVSGGVPLVRVMDIGDGRVDVPGLKRIASSIARRYPRTCLRGGEVLLSIVGTIGRTAIAPSALAGANVARAIAVIPVRDGVCPRWVELALRAPRTVAELTRASHEVARKTLNLEDVRKARLPIPPPQVQEAIVAEADRVLSEATQTDRLLAASGLHIARLRQSLLRLAFDGRLVPQDPRDEPASALLERIRDERTAASPSPKRKLARSRR